MTGEAYRDALEAMNATGSMCGGSLADAIRALAERCEETNATLAATVAALAATKRALKQSRLDYGEVLVAFDARTAERDEARKSIPEAEIRGATMRRRCTAAKASLTRWMCAWRHERRPWTRTPTRTSTHGTATGAARAARMNSPTRTSGTTAGARRRDDIRDR